MRHACSNSKLILLVRRSTYEIIYIYIYYSLICCPKQSCGGIDSCVLFDGRKEGNALFNDELNTFYLRLYGVGPYLTDRIALTTAFVTSVMEH